ncbi:hypothetical protein ACTA71_001594 [Dictyostelium dimigraforme]
MEILDKQAFLETREKLFTLSRSLNIIKQRIQISETDRKKCLVTIKELNLLTPETKTYKAVGKMFVISPIETLKTELEQQIEKDEEDVKGLINQSKYIDAQITDTERSLNELVRKK